MRVKRMLWRDGAIDSIHRCKRIHHTKSHALSRIAHVHASIHVDRQTTIFAIYETAEAELDMRTNECNTKTIPVRLVSY